MKQQQRPEQRIGYFPVNGYESPTQAKPKINWLRLAALLVCAIVFLTCLFLLGRYAYNILISRNASARLENAYNEAQQANTETPSPATATPTPAAAPTAALAAVPIAAPTQARQLTAAEIWPNTYSNNPTLRVSPIFYQLQAQNKDIIGWLKIEDVLEEAVLQLRYTPQTLAQIVHPDAGKPVIKPGHCIRRAVSGRIKEASDIAAFSVRVHPVAVILMKDLTGDGRKRIHTLKHSGIIRFFRLDKEREELLLNPQLNIRFNSDCQFRNS